MSFQTPITISDAISRIRDRRLLLPAIQREFVWSPDQVERLFDSLLQGYPIGSFLFWEVRDRGKIDYRYYEFLQHFRERYQIHNPEFNTEGHWDFDAVLDGQQRLTALYVGLTGTYAHKRPRVWWEDTERALPTRKLYLNVRAAAPDDDDEAGRLYEFSFLTDEDYAANPTKWFRVGRVLELVKAYDLNRMLSSEGYINNEFAAEALSTLHAAVHTDRIINCYSVLGTDMARALNVFVRVNSGGEPLSLSDMLMSTAIANWRRRDARREILGLVDLIQAKGFFITKDLILKSCLYLYSSDIRYKVSNFSAAQVQIFEDDWDSIQATILTVFDLVSDFGYNDTSLTSKNALLPIIYWVHHAGLTEKIRSQVGQQEERDTVRRWLHAMLLKAVFSGSVDTILAAIRRTFSGEEFKTQYIRPEVHAFPAAEIATVLKTQGRDPQITEEFIGSLLYTQYEDRQAFTLLALLAPNLDYKNGDFHKDHLHPAGTFRNKARLLAAGATEEDIAFFLNPNHWNSILNLRHLDANENKAKQDSTLADWVQKEAKRQQVSEAKFCDDHQLPTEPSVLSLGRFRDFIAARRDLLGRELQRLLG
jgi:Protein of unknown function DUF262